jgi:hypothetical protein
VPCAKAAVTYPKRFVRPQLLLIVVVFRGGKRLWGSVRQAPHWSIQLGSHEPSKDKGQSQNRKKKKQKQVPESNQVWFFSVAFLKMRESTVARTPSALSVV